MRIDLIRHGEPVGGRRYRGHGVDDPLSKKGWQQMQSAVQGEDWQYIISSPMRRCTDFAVWLSKRMHRPYRIETNFKEIGFGLWEGHSPDQIRAKNPSAWQAFYADPIAHPPPQAEPLAEFRSRVISAYQMIHQSACDSVLIIAHAGVIRAIITQVMQAPLASLYRLRIDPAGVSRILFSEQGEQLFFHNRQRFKPDLKQAI